MSFRTARECAGQLPLPEPGGLCCGCSLGACPFSSGVRSTARGWQGRLGPTASPGQRLGWPYCGPFPQDAWVQRDRRMLGPS